MSNDKVVPSEISRSGENDIKIEWNNGFKSVFMARNLRLACPCAGCIEEMTGRKIIQEDKIPEDVHPLEIHGVGTYAICIKWSDGHSTGIYTYDYLFRIASEAI